MNTLEDLLKDQLKDLYSAEQQLTKALPKVIRGASTPELKRAIEQHLEETQGQVGRLEEAAEHMEFTLRGKKCKAMEGLIEEGKELLEEEGDESVIDAGLIAAAQRVEHYEISAYGSARTLAEQLGLAEVAKLLQESLDEEDAADKKLTQISEGVVIPACKEAASTAKSDEEDEEDEDSDEEATSAGRRTNRQTASAENRGANRENSRGNSRGDSSRAKGGESRGSNSGSTRSGTRNGKEGNGRNSAGNSRGGRQMANQR